MTTSLMRQFTIRTRMLGAIGMVLGLLLLVGLVGLWGMQRMRASSDNFVQNPFVEVGHVARITLHLSELREAEGRLLHSLGNANETSAALAAWKAADDAVVANANKLLIGEEDPDNPVVRALLADQATYRSAFQGVADKVAKLEVSNAALLPALMAPALQAAAQVQTKLGSLQGVLAKEAQDDITDMQDTQQLVLMLFAASLGVTALLVIPLTLMNSISIVRPIDEAAALARDIAAGHLDTHVNTGGADEPAELLKALQAMQQSLGQIVRNIRQSSESISTASTEIASGNQDLSGRTEQTASNLQQTASSMEQLSGTVRQTADSARTANQLASSAAETAQRGGAVVAQVITNMDEINASSRKIAEIIGTIDGIAFQTNILALNAAVEAARAGEQGRGFAVVATEVRNLAQRSATAAREIKSLIGASVDKVESGSRLVNDAGSTMTEIVSGVQRVCDIIGEITAATTEQSSELGQVSGAVNQLDQMTQQNAALVEQSAAAAESLRDQAHKLSDVVRRFSVDGDAGASAYATPPTHSMASARPSPVSARPAAHKAPVKSAAVKAAAVAPSFKPPARPAATPPAAAAPATPRPAPVEMASATPDSDWETF
ncbi:MAG: methyl-accepting chemotaxis protein [Leptothrix sp. (in: b-proteobacteria)]